MNRAIVAVLILSVLMAAAVLWPAPARFRRGSATPAQHAAARRAAQVADAVDWDAVQDGAVRDLQTYLRFASINPPGREREAAEWLAGRLQAEGIAAVAEEASPGRYSVLARLPGAGSDPPIIFMHHLDVVPTGEGQWDHPPFGGVLAGGEVWGRGAVDDKGPGIMQVAALIALKRAGVRLNRDVILLAVADEEAGGSHGVAAMLERHPELRQAAFALIAEPTFVFELQGQMVMPVAVAEKGSVALTLRSEAEGGHASVPGPGQPLPELAAAMQRLAAAERPQQFSPEMVETLGRIGARAGGIKGWLLQRLSWAPVQRLAAGPISRDPAMNAMLRDTVAWTGLRSWVKYNVIPGQAEAMLDMRLLPGTDPAEALAWIQDTLALPGIQIQVHEQKAGNRTDFHTPWFGLIEAVGGQRYPDAVALPLLAPASSDARHLRAAGIPTYIAAPARVDRSLMETAHGRNERIPAGALGQGARFMFEFLVAAGGIS